MSYLEMLAATYRLPNPSTAEDLELRGHTVLSFGENVLVTGYYDGYFSAIYEHLDNDLSCEGPLGLLEISEEQFEDDGHAIQWAIKYLEGRL